MPQTEGPAEVRVQLADLRPSERAMLDTILRSSTLRRHEGPKVSATYHVTREAAYALARPPYGLTTREVEVLELIFDNLSNKGVAIRLGISPRTVEVHRQHIMTKLDATNVVDLVKIVMSIMAATGGVALKE